MAGAGFGVNLEGISDWAAVLPFVDAVKSARAFGSADQPWDGKAECDERGWPRGDAGLVVFANQQGIAGEYALSFRGRAKVTAAGGAEVAELAHEEATGTTRARVRVPEGTDSLFLSFRETNGGVRDVRLLRPVAAEGEFDRRLVEAVRPFGALRFMDWQHTNGCSLRTWAARPVPGDARWSGGAGVPLEVQIAFARATGCDAWFCVPHLADDDLVRRMAAMVCEGMPAGRKVYVEFSNECWNWQFPQARWCAEQGKAAGLGENAFQAQLRFYSQRTVEVARIWKEVFRGRPGDLVRVMASQGANPWVSEQVLGWKDAAREVDALAIAPYFGHAYGSPGRRAEVAGWTPDALLDRLAQHDLAKELPESLRKQREVAGRFKVKLVCYEAGQHLAGHGGIENDEAITRLFMAANRHPRMGELYRTYLGLWRELDVGPMFLFSFSSRPSKWGSWGLVEGLPPDPARHPKWAAARDLLGQP